MDGVLHILSVERVLQLGREDRDPVEEQREIDGVVVLLAVSELADDRKEVGSVQSARLLVQLTRWPEERELDLDARILDAVPQHIERAAALDFARQAAQELLADPRAVVLRQTLPRLRL